jgi:hypothetical protein
MTRQLFELVGTDADRPFSPYCWRTRMALAHKGLDVTSVPWRFTEREAIAQHQSEKVPVLIDGDRTVSDPGRSPSISKTPIPIAPRCSAAKAAARWGGC